MIPQVSACMTTVVFAPVLGLKNARGAPPDEVAIRANLEAYGKRDAAALASAWSEKGEVASSAGGAAAQRVPSEEIGEQRKNVLEVRLETPDWAKQEA